MSKVWLITGSAHGLGRKVAEAALTHGDRLIATARDPRRLSDLIDCYGDQVLTVALDVTDASAAHAAVQAGLERFGRIDVLVNNAGFGHVAPFEQCDAASFRDQIETNFYGVVNVTRAVLPIMREQRSGHIFQVSSVGGRIGTPGLAAYQSAKWAVGGFSEVLNQEVGPLGIKVCVLEPGGMRTSWGTRASQNIPGIHPDYAPTVGSLADLLQKYAGEEASDPNKVAHILLRLAYHDRPPLHLLLGSDAVQYAGEADVARAAAGERWRNVSVASDVVASITLPELPTA